MAKLILLAADFEQIPSPTKELDESIFWNEVYLIVLGASLKFPLPFIVLRLDEDVARCSPHSLLNLKPARIRLYSKQKHQFKNTFR